MSLKNSVFSLSRVLIVLSLEGSVVTILNYIFYIIAFVQLFYLNLVAVNLDESLSILISLKNFTKIFTIMPSNFNTVSLTQIILFTFEVLFFIMIILALNLAVEAERKRISTALKVYVLKGLNYSFNTIFFVPLTIILKNSLNSNLQSDDISLFFNFMFSQGMIITVIVLSNLYLMMINKIGYDFRTNESNKIGKSSNFHEFLFQIIRLILIFGMDLNQYIIGIILIILSKVTFSHLRHHQPFYDKFEYKLWNLFALCLMLTNIAMLGHHIAGTGADTVYTTISLGLIYFIILEWTHRSFVEDTILSVLKPLKDSEQVHRRMRLISRKALEIGNEQSLETMDMMLLAARSEIDPEKLNEFRKLESTANEDQIVLRLKILSLLREKIEDEFKIALQVAYCYFLFEKCHEKVECLDHCNKLLRDTSKLSFSEEMKINFYKTTLEEELMSDAPQLSIGIRVMLD